MKKLIQVVNRVYRDRELGSDDKSLTIDVLSGITNGIPRAGIPSNTPLIFLLTVSRVTKIRLPTIIFVESRVLGMNVHPFPRFVPELRCI